MFSGGGQRKSVHCVHPEYWKPVLDNNIKDVLNVHSEQAFNALPQRTPVIHNKLNRGHSSQQYVLFLFKSHFAIFKLYIKKDIF
jgi:hypothetical protein